MSNLAVASIKLIGSSGAITNAAGDITYLTYNSSGNIGVNGIVFPIGTQTKAVNTVADLLTTTPSNGNSLVFNGSAWIPGETPGRLLSVNAYTNDSGSDSESIINMRDGGTWTWTKPSGCRYVLVYCTGAGAGSNGNDSAYRAFTGGGGATAIGRYDVSSVNTVTVTTGSGSQGVRGMGRPGTGGTSSFGSFCSASGGRGGAEAPWGGGRGGIATGGNIANLPGGGGEGTHSADWEGGGGASFWHKTGGAHNNGTGQGDTDADRRERVKGRFGSGGGSAYGSQFADESWRSGGAGYVVVYSYS
jgi:hypothetical protein